MTVCTQKSERTRLKFKVLVLTWCSPQGPGAHHRGWCESLLENWGIYIGSLKDLCSKPEGSGDERPKAMAKTRASPKKWKGNPHSFFPFYPMQATSLLVGASHIQPRSSFFNFHLIYQLSRHTQNIASLIC